MKKISTITVILLSLIFTVSTKARSVDSVIPKIFQKASKWVPSSPLKPKEKDSSMKLLQFSRGGASGKVKEVKTQEEVEQILKDAEDKLVVIDFTAVWCGPCQMIAPAYEQFSESAEFKDVIFLKCDVDDNKETASKYKVYQMPTFVFIKNGEVVRTFTGASPVKLKQTLESLQEDMAMDNK